MNRLVGDFVDVEITLKKCRGLSYVKHPIILSATLCGKKYQCLPFKAVENASFNHQFTWKVSTADVKKMRSGKEIVRIDCYTYNTKGEREPIAFLLLHVRCADIVLEQAKQPVLFTWKKLLGAPSSITKPEILMAFCVKERRLDRSRSSDTLSESSSSQLDNEDQAGNRRVSFAGTGSIQW